MRDLQEIQDLEVEVRQATGKDINELVIPSWLQSYSRSLIAKLMRADGRYYPGREKYWSYQRKRIEDILASPTVRVLVATVDGDSVGWACEDRSHLTLHYVYVKETFRKQGIARKLAGWIDNPEQGIVTLSHLPPPFYSRPDPSSGKVLWKPHVLIDLISGR